MLFICNKFHVIIFDSFTVTEGIRSPDGGDGNNFTRNVGRGMVLVVCTLMMV